MGSIIAKFQRCGKSNCHCAAGSPHGPYLWLVTYQRKEPGRKKGRYKWKYLGRNVQQVVNSLKEMGVDHLEPSLEETIRAKVVLAEQEVIKGSNNKSSSRRVLVFPKDSD